MDRLKKMGWSRIVGTILILLVIGFGIKAGPLAIPFMIIATVLIVILLFGEQGSA